ncbi:unnamed protein product [marine sediment metagenome]|uniref:Uncharacterized protein n=1 Tax=marine sediment metagenome TaxID=412755 RepID=X1IJC2_9ZZZZ
MDIAFRDKFIQQWAKYFPSAPLPIWFYRDLTQPPAIPRGSESHALPAESWQTQTGEQYNAGRIARRVCRGRLTGTPKEPQSEILA